MRHSAVASIVYLFAQKMQVISRSSEKKICNINNNNRIDSIDFYKQVVSYYLNNNRYPATMISVAIIDLAVVGVTCLLLLTYLYRFVFRYKHEYESNPLCTTAVLFCLTIVFLTTFILPIDIFLVSFIKDTDGRLKDWATPELLEKIDKGVLAAYYGKSKPSAQ